jgi:DNA-binding winged helix-turn-helix (wHTH) protein
MPVELPPQAFALLLYLVETPDRLIAGKELAAHLWPEISVCRGSLHQLVWIVRRALGEQRGTSRYIKTTRGHGYRFVAPVQVQHALPHELECA